MTAQYKKHKTKKDEEHSKAVELTAKAQENLQQIMKAVAAPAAEVAAPATEVAARAAEVVAPAMDALTDPSPQGSETSTVQCLGNTLSDDTLLTEMVTETGKGEVIIGPRDQKNQLVTNGCHVLCFSVKNKDKYNEKMAKVIRCNATQARVQLCEGPAKDEFKKIKYSSLVVLAPSIPQKAAADTDTGIAPELAPGPALGEGASTSASSSGLATLPDDTSKQLFGNLEMY